MGIVLVTILSRLIETSLGLTDKISAFGIFTSVLSGTLCNPGVRSLKSAVILRKISKYVAGTDSDAIMPIPVFIDPYNDKIVADGLPLELREELADESFLTGSDD